MKPTALRVCLLLGLLALSLYAAASAQLPAHVRLQTLGPDTADFPGLLNYENGELSGRYRELFSCVGAALRITFVYSGIPFVRAQRNVAAGDVHGFFPANRTAHRDLFAHVSAPLMADQKVLLSRADLQPPDPQQLLSYVGVMRGAHYELTLAETLQRPIAVVDSYDQLARMLSSGRVGAIVVSEMFINATLSKFKDSQTYTREVLGPAAMHAYFSKRFLADYPAFLPAFNDALDTCRGLPDGRPHFRERY